MPIIVQEKEFQRIASHWAYDFKKDVLDTYSRLCEQNRRFYIPADTQLVEELMVWCHEAASYLEFSDQHYYKTLVDDTECNEFYAKTANEHFFPFIKDVMKVAKQEHLFMKTSYEFINFPITEVW